MLARDHGWDLKPRRSEQTGAQPFGSAAKIYAPASSGKVAGTQPHNRLLSKLPPESLLSLSENLSTRHLPVNAVCFTSGAAVAEVYFPLTGAISLTSTTRDGKTLRAAMIGREGAAGLQSTLSNRESLTQAVVQAAGSFQIISAHRLRALACHDASIKEWIYRYTERTWQEAVQMTMCNAVHDASSRLCRCLLQSADCTGSEQLPLTQELLAEMLGVRRTTITEQARLLQRLDLISYSRGTIALLNRSELEKHACECYRTLKCDEATGGGQALPSLADADSRVEAMEKRA